MRGLGAGRRGGAAGRRPAAGSAGAWALAAEGGWLWGRGGEVGAGGEDVAAGWRRPCCSRLGTKPWSGGGARPPPCPARPPLSVANVLRRISSPVTGPTSPGVCCLRPERPLPASGSGLSGVGLLCRCPPRVVRSLKRSCFASSAILTVLAAVSAPVPTFRPVPRGLTPYSLVQARQGQLVIPSYPTR